MINIRPMTEADLPIGLSLSLQSGWNQSDADWRRCLDMQPDGCFVAEWDGNPVGTTTTCIFGNVAWIAMVLVDERLRGRGVGMALMRHALAFVDEQHVTSVRLDATPLGQPLYEKLGFIAEFRLARYEGILSAAPTVVGVEAAIPEQWDALAALDEAVAGTNRRALLFRLFAERPESVRVTRTGADPSGFMASRTGSRAVHLGPCIAAPDASPLLFMDAWSRYSGQRVVVDIPVLNVAATRAAEAQGLTVQRYVTRMYRGTPPGGRSDWLWSAFGPEKG
jgi:ribosomal protein S18 acetylase RimI-like enzyme